MMFADNPPQHIDTQIIQLENPAEIQEEKNDKPKEEATSDSRGFHFSYLTAAGDQVDIELPSSEENEEEKKVNTNSRSRPLKYSFSKAAYEVATESSEEEEEQKNTEVQENLSASRPYKFFFTSQNEDEITDEIDEEEKKNGTHSNEFAFLMESEIETDNPTTLPEEEEIKEEESKALHSYFFRKMISDGSSEEMKALTPSQDQLLAYAKKIVSEIFSNGFQWEDLIEMMKLSNEMISKDFPELDDTQKKTAIISVLDHIVDITDTPYLPDQFTDPLFKLMIPPFVDLVLPIFNHESLIEPVAFPVEGKPTLTEISDYAQRVLKIFSNGFQWNDLASIVRISVEIIKPYEELDAKEKEDAVISIIDEVIDSIDISFLPDAFVHPVFKSLVRPIVSLIINSI